MFLKQITATEAKSHFSLIADVELPLAIIKKNQITAVVLPYEVFQKMHQAYEEMIFQEAFAASERLEAGEDIGPLLTLEELDQALMQANATAKAGTLSKIS